MHEGLHPFDHDHEIIAQMVHVPDVLPGKISPVQDESRVLITIRSGFVQHELQL